LIKEPNKIKDQISCEIEENYHRNNFFFREAYGKEVEAIARVFGTRGF